MSNFLDRRIRDVGRWLPQDREAATRQYTKRFWSICGAVLLAEVVLLGLIIRYIPLTNVDYRAYIQQSRRFLNVSPGDAAATKNDEPSAGQNGWGRAAWFLAETLGVNTHHFEVTERRYSMLVGETGPLVYPALHLYLFTLLDMILPFSNHLLYSNPEASSDPAKISHIVLDREDRRTVLPLQVLWAGVYLGTMGMVLWIYREAARGRALEAEAETKKDRDTESQPTITRNNADKSIWRDLSTIVHSPAQLSHLIPLLMLSKRLHSIYVLRLFNDPLAMMLFYGSMVLCVKGRWNGASTLFSFALGVKMNILLYLPGMLVLQFQYRGLLGLLEGVLVMLVVQFALPAQFFLGSQAEAIEYFSTAFDLSRKFLFKWSVNLAFLGKEVFEGEVLSKVLLAAQALLLIAFAWFKWSSMVPGGTGTVLARGLLGPWKRPPIIQSARDGYHIPLVLFTSNFIGIICARSLHYQFHSWYAHQLPLLLWYGRSRLWVSLCLWLVIQATWDSFPPSKTLSAGMLAAHVYILGCIFIRT